MWTRARLVSVLILVGAAALIAIANWDVRAAVLLALLIAGIVLLTFPRIGLDVFPKEPMPKRARLASALVILVGEAAVIALAKRDVRAAVLLALLIAGVAFLVVSRRMR